MKASKIIIKNIFGITEQVLDGTSIEITGANGTGKTSVIDAIRYALTNKSERDYIVRNGENEGEILIETDTGLSINRKKRANMSDYKMVKDNESEVPAPESFLGSLFTPLQLNPVEFTQLSRQEQNRRILDLIDFKWDLSWIRERFGEIPPGIDYNQNILQVLSDIQSDNGHYFQTRQEINRDIRNKSAFIADIAKDIPKGYAAEKWETFDMSGKYEEVAKIKDMNGKIQRAKTFKDNYDNQRRGFEAEMEIKKSEFEKQMSDKRETLRKNIERCKYEIAAAEKELSTISEKITDKFAVFESEFEQKLSKLEADVLIAAEYAGKEIGDTSEIEQEIGDAKEMIKHLNEYNRMKAMQNELEELHMSSEALTRKIELARELPSEILRTATIPIDGLEVKDGIPLIHGLPVSNLSEGEKLDLCVDIAISNPNSLQMILLDGTEKLSDENRCHLYEKCKTKGLQFIATRTTNDNELLVTKL